MKIRNDEATPVDTILDQLKEPRPLPMGRQEFLEWSDRIIAGACIPGGEDDPQAFHESQRFALANMIMHLGPTESHKPDAHFIHTLRKVAINQVATSMMNEIKKKHEEDKIRKEAEAQALAEASALAEETLKRAESLKLVKNDASEEE